MARVESAYAQSITGRASFPHLVPRQRCQDHPIAMFNCLVFAAFVWTLVPTASTLAPFPVSSDHASSVPILGTTPKTSRLPKRDVIHICPERDLVRNWLECLTEIAHESGEVDRSFG